MNLSTEMPQKGHSKDIVIHMYHVCFHQSRNQVAAKDRIFGHKISSSIHLKVFEKSL